MNRSHSMLIKGNISQTVRKSMSFRKGSIIIKPKSKVPFTKEIIEIIASFYILNPACIIRLANVCQIFRETMEKEMFWKNMLFFRYPSSKEKIKNNFKYACLQMDYYFQSRLYPTKLEAKKKSKNTIEYKIALIGDKDVGKR